MNAESKNIEIKGIFEIWVSSKGSKATRESYKRVVPQFFKLMFDKKVEDITELDVLGIIPMVVEERYINYLIKEEGMKESTIKNYLAIVSSFIEYLSSNKLFDVNYKFITDIALSGKSLKDDSGKRELMPEEEYESFREWLMNKKFAKRYGNLNEKYALALELMYSTAIRIDAAFNKLKWSGIVWETDLMGNKGWTIYVVDKGSKTNRKPINNDLYNRLRETFYNEDDGDDGLVLTGASKQSFTRLMKEYSEETGIKMTPHSIKVGAGTKLYSMTKDIVLTSKFLDHADTKTTERYIRTDDDRTNTGSYIMSTPIDECQLEVLSLDDLKDILDKRSDLKRAILLEASKMKRI